MLRLQGRTARPWRRCRRHGLRHDRTYDFIGTGCWRHAVGDGGELVGIGALFDLASIENAAVVGVEHHEQTLSIAVADVRDIMPSGNRRWRENAPTMVPQDIRDLARPQAVLVIVT